MKAEKKYQYHVTHPARGVLPVQVDRKDPAAATVEAARVWGVPWKTEAGNMRVEYQGPALERHCICGRRIVGNDEYCPACAARRKQQAREYFRRYPVNKDRREEARH